MAKKVMITETILRDAHQSQAATRMTTEQMLPMLDQLDDIGYYSLEAWGGATFDSCLRFLHEDPWERLRILKSHLKKTKIQMLLRGQNLLGYKHYADDVVEKFIEYSIKNGVDVIRVFDALNDVLTRRAPFIRTSISLNSRKNARLWARIISALRIWLICCCRTPLTNLFPPLKRH